MGIDYSVFAIPKGEPLNKIRRRAKRKDGLSLKAWRDAVWRRESEQCGLEDGHAICQRCSAYVVRIAGPRFGHVHHVVSRRHHETRYTVSNGRLLCRRCHNKVHGREF